MEEKNVITEVPAALKRLAKYVVHGFYGAEFYLAFDVLIRYPCVKEDDLLRLLNYEHKQLRTVLNTLKADKLVKLRMRVETGPNGKSTRHNYYYINYKVLVDVVKYKLDHMRRKIEADERDSTTRSSFKCPSCSSTYSDLEVNQLFDVFTETFCCTYCNTEVEEDASALPKRDAQTLLAKFNEQMEPIFVLLREIEDIVLPYDLLEPQPKEIPELTESFDQVESSILESCSQLEKLPNRSFSFGNMYTQNLVIDVQDSETRKKRREKATKDQPIWMSQSTIEGATTASNSSTVGVNASEESAKETLTDNEIIKSLLRHEFQSPSSSSSTDQAPVVKSRVLEPDSDTNDSEEEAKHSRRAGMETAGRNVGQEKKEQEMLDPILMVGGQPHSYGEVCENPELVSLMTKEEREAYIKVGQEMFQSVFE